jgi:hypothetical protein
VTIAKMLGAKAKQSIKFPFDRTLGSPNQPLHTAIPITTNHNACSGTKQSEMIPSKSKDLLRSSELAA